MAKLYAGVERKVARCAEVQAGLAAAATRIAARARAIAEAHADSGAFAASIGTSKGKVDHFVHATDPDAISKEFGRTGETGHGTSKGVYALTTAMGEAAERRATR